jgi:simple sugar transport system substrate-binding protein
MFPGFGVFAPTTVQAADDFIFGMLLVGPYNDKGYSQAHYEGGKYVEEKIPGAKMMYLDKVNPADRAGFTIPQLVDDLVSKGRK